MKGNSIVLAPCGFDVDMIIKHLFLRFSLHIR